MRHLLAGILAYTERTFGLPPASAKRIHLIRPGKRSNLAMP
jgi:hypothetical protein